MSRAAAASMMDAGTYTVVVSGTGVYGGSVEKAFVIEPKKTIFAAVSYTHLDVYKRQACGSSGSWSNTYRTTVRDTKISSGSYVGGIAPYGSNAYDCTVTGSTITGSKYIGGALGWSYGNRVDSTGVTDSVIGADSARYAGGLIGGSYESSSCLLYTSRCV